MKIFQIIDNKCHWDATAQFPAVESTVGFFPPDDLFVEAPDNVCEGWGYANGEFTEPQSPAEEDEPTEAERLRADVDYIAAMTGVSL